MTKPELLIPHWNEYKPRIQRDLSDLTEKTVASISNPSLTYLVVKFDRLLFTTFFSFADITYLSPPRVTELYSIGAIGRSEDIYGYIENALTHEHYASLICDRETRDAVKWQERATVWYEGDNNLVFSVAPNRVVELFNP